MGKLSKIIEKWVEEHLEESSHFLVGVFANEAETKIRVAIDGEGGVSIQMCSQVNRMLSRRIDEEDLGEHPFIVEVSSPGVDMGLVDKRQYPQHVTRRIEVTGKDGKTTDGYLEEVKDEGISVLLKKKKKKDPDEWVEVNWEDIETAKVIPELNAHKRKNKTKPKS